MEALWLLGTLVSPELTPPQLCRLAASCGGASSLAMNSLAPPPDPGFRWIAPASSATAGEGDRLDDIGGMGLSITHLDLCGSWGSGPSISVAACSWGRAWTIAAPGYAACQGSGCAFYAVAASLGCLLHLAPRRAQDSAVAVVFSDRNAAWNFAVKDAPDFFSVPKKY